MAKEVGVSRYDPNTEAFQARAQWKKVDNCRKQWIERWSWLLDERKQAQNEANAVRQEVAAALPHVMVKSESTKSLKPVPITSSGIIGWLGAKHSHLLQVRPRNGRPRPRPRPDCQLEIYTSWIAKIPLRLPDAWNDKEYLG